MSKRNKINLIIFLLVDAVLLAVCFWEIFRPDTHFGIFTLFEPRGIVALKQRTLILTAVLIMLVGAVPVYFSLFFFAWKYRAGKKVTDYDPSAHSIVAAILIWVIPMGVIFTLSVLNWKSTHELDPSLAIASSKKPLTIEVVALQWKFLFIYPEQNIATVNFIEFPAGTPLSFELTADAPMSSFWIPQLGSQIYAMAGMQTQLHLMASQTGDFRGMDTEINGAGFSGMKFIARSASEAGFDTWVNTIKSSSNKLNLDLYNQLSQPSQNNPAAYYASVDPGLYDTIMMKNMMPMTDEQMQQMSRFGMGMTASSTMSMPGMQMSSSSTVDMQGMDMTTSSPMKMPGMDMK